MLPYFLITLKSHAFQLSIHFLFLIHQRLQYFKHIYPENFYTKVIIIVKGMQIARRQKGAWRYYLRIKSDVKKWPIANDPQMHAAKKET